MTQKALSIRDMTVGYGRRPAVIDGLDLDIAAGSKVAVLGPNGSGKSTLLHSMLGLIPLRRGEVRFDGRPLAAQQRSRVGFCADDLPLPELLTGREYICFSAVARGVVLAEDHVESLFAATNMAGAQSRMIREYSHGMKRKLMLLANIMHSPTLLILDEPFRGLDPEAHAIMLDVITRIAARGGIVLISTHDLAVASRMSDKVLIIDGGAVRYHGAFADESRTTSELTARFSGIVDSGAGHIGRADLLFATLEGLRRAP